MTETRQYDLLNRLTSITSTPASAAELPVGFSYQYNQANQRVRATLRTAVSGSTNTIPSAR
jgi:hypothetical protein